MYVSFSICSFINRKPTDYRSSICVTAMNRLMLNLRDPELTEHPRVDAALRSDDTSLGFTTEYITTFIEPGPSRDSGEDYRLFDHETIGIQGISPNIDNRV